MMTSLLIRMWRWCAISLMTTCAMIPQAAAQLSPSPGTPGKARVTLTVVDKSTNRPIFARVVLKDPAGKIIESTGYQTLNGHFVPPDGWTVTLSPGRYTIQCDAGFEFHAIQEFWDFDGAAEKKIELQRWVNFRQEGWFSGGDHNHLIRGGAENKNYGGTSVTLEFAAALKASRGWSYFQAGGGGHWLVEGNTRPLHGGRQTEDAAAQWNHRYGEHLHLGWNNEILKTRYGHLWFVGTSTSGPTYPYTDKPGDAWWAFYDESWDPWQTVDKSQPIGPYKSSLWNLPPHFDCIRHWRDQGLVAIYAHPTRTFRIGKMRVSNIAVAFPFDLLAGAPVGGLVVMGDAPDHANDQALWFAALNEGYQVPGIAENDTVFGGQNIRANPHVTYTHVPEMGASFNPERLATALATGRNFVSSGAFCVLRADEKYRMGDTVPEMGQLHELEVQAWASADPSDTIDVLEIIADGKVVERIRAAAGQRRFSGKITLNGVRWVIAKVICKNKNAVAITNPIYFRKPSEPKTPEPFRSTVSGRVNRHGSGIPAEIIVRAWGEEVSRAKASVDGIYVLENVPLAAHLTFQHAGTSAEQTLLFHAPEIAAIHAKIWRTDFADHPDALAGAFPPDFFRMLRDLAKEITLDVDLAQ